MKFKFWGVRGSIPAPGPHTVRYGGNTTCIEVRSSDNHLLILDAGTGIYPLSQTLSTSQPLTVHIFLTHSHWDHIQGLPFFKPLLSARSDIHLYGGRDPNTGQGIERVLSMQMQHNFFPISQEQIKAKVTCHTLQANQSLRIGNALITPVLLNHPGDDFGYRIDDDDGSSLFFTGDYEPPADLSEAHVGLDVMSGVQCLIVDASYTEQEYEGRRGWGHGTFDSGVELAKQCACQQLMLTHHESLRTDDELELLYQDLLSRVGNPGFPILLAREGDEYDLAAR